MSLAAYQEECMCVLLTQSSLRLHNRNFNAHKISVLENDKPDIVTSVLLKEQRIPENISNCR